MKKIDLYINSIATRINEKFFKIFKDVIFKDKISQTIIVVSSVFLLIVWGLSLFYFKVSGYLVPIRYNSFFGVTEIGNWYDLYRIPAFFTLSFVLNLALSRVIYTKDKLIGYILLATNIFLAFITIMVIINFGRILAI